MTMTINDRRLVMSMRLPALIAIVGLTACATPMAERRAAFLQNASDSCLLMGYDAGTDLYMACVRTSIDSSIAQQDIRIAAGMMNLSNLLERQQMINASRRPVNIHCFGC